jgi:hypothetical protein
MVTGALGANLLLGAGPSGLPLEPPGVLNHWAHWDGGWYSAIARDGYFDTLWPASSNFFPFYPLLIRVGTLVVGGPAVWGVAISLACSLFALYFLHEIAADCFGDEAARAATLALAFFPTAFFLNAVYTEALFLAAATGCVWAARMRGDFALAGMLGFVAAGTRNVGVLLIFPLVHEWLRHRQRAGRTGLVWLALVPIGLLSYMFWLWRWSSHPLLFTTVVKRTWGRTLTNPITTLDHGWTRAVDGVAWAVHPERVFATTSPNPSYNAMETFNFVFLVLLFVLLVGTVVLVPRGLAVYAVVASLEPLLTPAYVQPLASLPRYLLSAFPLFLFLGVVLARSRVLLIGWLVASSALGVLLTLYFTTWRWVG